MIFVNHKSSHSLGGLCYGKLPNIAKSAYLLRLVGMETRSQAKERRRWEVSPETVGRA